MEFINRLELRGIVGRADVSSFNNSQVCNFSVVTDYSTVDREGNSAIDSTWFNVAAWSGRPGIPDLSTIQKGSWVEVVGRVRVRRYMTQDNEERSSLDVIAREVRVLQRDTERMQPQRD